ncbi:DUF1566 domain-containing protein [Pandoraea pnomenusa]|uniref:DUF1566 domain-containing protein n=1 Tax=Pandoraea pnomenusa TaxID=93220 RepID=UPI0033406C59
MTQVAIPPLNDGEIYLCGIVDANGDVEHTAIVAINNERGEWQEQMEWAKSLGADLMTRTEQAIAFAKHKDRFEEAGYWSNEDAGDGFAWFQYFYDGYQDFTSQHRRLRAVAVRRFKN